VFSGKAKAPTLEAPEVEPVVEQAEHRPAREAKVFQPSSFASRSADAGQRRAERAERRLASLGPTEFPQRDTRTGEVHFLDAELFMDIDKPMQRFVQIDGMPGLHALHDDTRGKENQVTPIPGTFRRNGRGPSSLSEPSPPDSRRPV
jgi:hypothetical protein